MAYLVNLFSTKESDNKWLVGGKRIEKKAILWVFATLYDEYIRKRPADL